MTPVVFIRHVKDLPTPKDGGLHVTWKDQLWAGMIYKGNSGIAINAGGRISERLRIGYSAEVHTGEIASQSGTSHEVMVGYSFGLLSKQLKKQQEQIDDLDEYLKYYEEKQDERDAAQEELLEKQQQQIDTLSEEYRNAQEKLEQLEQELDGTQEDLEDLKQQLRDAGVLREEGAGEFQNLDGSAADPGYYMVIASVKDTRYNPQAMQTEYLDKGYNVVYNTVRGWYYVYTEKPATFPEALELLKTTRAGEHKDAWIHILK